MCDKKEFKLLFFQFIVFTLIFNCAKREHSNPLDPAYMGPLAPTYSPLPGTYTTAQNVTITCSALGATIHYTTNGADPTERDPTVTSGDSVTISSTTTLKARAYKSGWNPSDVTSGIFTITGTVAMPTFSPSPSSTYTTAPNVTITCSTLGATIHYTTNGSDPTESDASIISGASVTISITTTLKARAYKSGWNPSDVASETYTLTVTMPTFSPSPGTYPTAQNVTITCSTSGVTIHYTTNGADPTESDPIISNGGSVTVAGTTTLKARAYKSGWNPSDVAIGVYIIFPFIEWITVQGGTFQMGNTLGDGESDELPVHSVILSSYEISKYETTNYQYATFLNMYGSNKVKSGYYSGQTMVYEHDMGLRTTNGIWVPDPGYENYPVINVTWYGAYEFCRYSGCRLPTEAEWEYAAKGGNSSQGYRYSGGNTWDEVAWCWNNSSGHTHQVGMKNVNELGIYDMSGNVSEYCQDWYDAVYYSSSPGTNPKGPGSGTYCVIRGGDWGTDSNKCRCENRAFEWPDQGQTYRTGFRPVR